MSKIPKISLLLILMFEAAVGFASYVAGPGVQQRRYKEKELYQTLSIIKTSKPGVRGHAALNMFNGYLGGVEALDNGKGDGAIAFFDISDPKDPKRIATHINEHTRDLFEGHNYGFIKINGRDIVFMIAQRGLQIWDWTDIYSIQHLCSLDLPRLKMGAYANTGWWLALQYPYVYIGATNTGLQIIDATDLKHPKLVKRIPLSKLGGFPIGSLYACGNQLICTGFDRKNPKNASWNVMDISNPINPRLLQTVKGVFGYSGLFNGGYVFSIEENPKIWDMRNVDSIILAGQYQGPKVGSKGGYGLFQDGFLHMGASNAYAKLDVSNPSRPTLVKQAKRNIKKQDFDGATPIGQYTIMSCDHGTGTHIVVHQSMPDRTGPNVNYMHPIPDSTNNNILSRIGLTFTDEIDHVISSSARVYRVGGKDVPGNWSLHNSILNFTPKNPLENAATYTVELPPGSVKDVVGNPIENIFRASFSTGNILSDFKVKAQPVASVEFGQTSKFSIVDSTFKDALYAWDFGDGSPRTDYSSTLHVEHKYQNPGRYDVILYGKYRDQRATSQCFHLVHLPVIEPHPRNSSTISYDHKNDRIWVVNPDNGTVSVLQGKGLRLLAEIDSGVKPRTLSISSGIVAVTDQEGAKLHIYCGKTLKSLKNIDLAYGSQPYGVVLSSDARKAWVAGEAIGHLFEIEVDTGKVEILHRFNHGLRGISLANNERNLLVTRFRSPDSGGEIHKVDLSNKFMRLVFGNKIQTIKLAMDTGSDTEISGRGIPNYLSQIVVSPDGQRASIPSKKDNIQRGVLRDGLPLSFQNTVRTIVSQIDLNLGKEFFDKRVDVNDRDMLQAAAYSPQGDLLFVAAQGSDSIEVINVYTGEHLTSINHVGAAPQGLFIDPEGILFVNNFLDRSVSSYDVSAFWKKGSRLATRLDVQKTITDDALPPKILLGKKVFYNARNPSMSRDGYISCASCHLDGGDDGRVWDFADRGEGLRNTISLVGRSSHEHGRLHWSANFDELQDFEHQIRSNFGGEGFISDNSPASKFHDRNPTLGNPIAGRSESLDALADYILSLDKVPDSPYRKINGQMTKAGVRGRKIFKQLNCASCHGGNAFTDSSQGYLHDVGTLKPTSGKRLYGRLNGIDTPSLKGIWATSPYLHDGSAPDLKAVLVDSNQGDQHGNISLLNESEVNDLIAYLLQIDENEPMVAKTNIPTSGKSFLTTDQRSLANEIYQAFEDRIPLAPISLKLSKEEGLDYGYEIQSVFNRLISKRYGSVRGYNMKSPRFEIQNKQNISKSIYGFFMNKQKVASGGRISLDKFMRFHIESGIFFTMKRNVNRRFKSVNQLMPYIKSVHVGLNIFDLPYDRTRSELTLVDLVATNFGSKNYVIGKGSPPEKIDFETIQLAFKHNNNLLYDAEVNEFIEDPRDFLRLLSNELFSKGRPLKRGQFVFSGSLINSNRTKKYSENQGHYTVEGTGFSPAVLHIE